MINPEPCNTIVQREVYLIHVLTCLDFNSGTIQNALELARKRNWWIGSLKTELKFSYQDKSKPEHIIHIDFRDNNLVDNQIDYERK